MVNKISVVGFFFVMLLSAVRFTASDYTSGVYSNSSFNNIKWAMMFTTACATNLLYKSVQCKPPYHLGVYPCNAK